MTVMTGFIMVNFILLVVHIRDDKQPCHLTSTAALNTLWVLTSHGHIEYIVPQSLVPSVKSRTESFLSGRSPLFSWSIPNVKPEAY